MADRNYRLIVEGELSDRMTVGASASESGSVGEYNLAPTSVLGTLDAQIRPDPPIDALIQRSGLVELCERDGQGDVERQTRVVDDASARRGLVRW